MPQDTYKYKSPKTGKEYEYQWDKPEPPSPNDFKALEKMVEDEERSTPPPKKQPSISMDPLGRVTRPLEIGMPKTAADRDPAEIEALRKQIRNQAGNYAFMGMSGQYQEQREKELNLPPKPGKSHGKIIDALWNAPGQAKQAVKDFATGMYESIPAVQGAKYEREHPVDWDAVDREMKKTAEDRKKGIEPPPLKFNPEAFKTDPLMQEIANHPIKFGLGQVGRAMDVGGMVEGQYDVTKGAVEDFAKGNLGGGAVKGTLALLPLLGARSTIKKFRALEATEKAALEASQAAEAAKPTPAVKLGPNPAEVPAPQRPIPARSELGGFTKFHNIEEVINTADKRYGKPLTEPQKVLVREILEKYEGDLMKAPDEMVPASKPKGSSSRKRLDQVWDTVDTIRRSRSKGEQALPPAYGVVPRSLWPRETQAAVTNLAPESVLRNVHPEKPAYLRGKVEQAPERMVQSADELTSHIDDNANSTVRRQAESHGTTAGEVGGTGGGRVTTGPDAAFASEFENQLYSGVKPPSIKELMALGQKISPFTRRGESAAPTAGELISGNTRPAIGADIRAAAERTAGQDIRGAMPSHSIYDQQTGQKVGQANSAAEARRRVGAKNEAEGTTRYAYLKEAPTKELYSGVKPDLEIIKRLKDLAPSLGYKAGEEVPAPKIPALLERESREITPQVKPIRGEVEPFRAEQVPEKTTYSEAFKKDPNISSPLGEAGKYDFSRLDEEIAAASDESSNLRNRLTDARRRGNEADIAKYQEASSNADVLLRELTSTKKFGEARPELAKKLGYEPKGNPPPITEVYSGVKPEIPKFAKTELKKLRGTLEAYLKGAQGKKVKYVPKEALDPQLKPVNMNEPYGQLVNAIREATPHAKAQQELIHADRVRKAASIQKVETKGMRGHFERLGLLRGSSDRVVTKPLKINIEPFINDVYASKNLKPYEQVNAAEGLRKLKAGQALQDSEIMYLQEVFGKGFGDEIRNMYAGLPINIDLVGPENFYDALNTTKALNSFGEMSFGFRQGLGAIHTKPFWTSWGKAAKAGFSESFYTAKKAAIEADPFFPLAEKSGVALTDVSRLAQREDQFVSRFAEKIPVVGKLIKANHRAASTFLNEIRFQNFKALLRDAKNQGLNPQANAKLVKDIAEYVNVSTGRGSLGKLEAFAGPLNVAFYSPRLIASRMKILNSMNPLAYRNSPMFIRKQYLKSLASIAATGVTANILGNMLGGETGDNPVSSDLGKVKFGNMRLDPWGGLQQYVVLANRMVAGAASSITGKEYDLGENYGSPTRRDKLGEFFGNKLSPVASMFYDWLGDSDYKGNPIEWKARVIEGVIPLFLQDMYELSQEDPQLFPLFFPGFVGMGVQNLGETKTPLSKDLAEGPFGFIPPLETGGRKKVKFNVNPTSGVTFK